MKRNITKLLRLNYREKQRLHNHAGKCGMSEEAYLRSLLNGVSPREMPPPDYHAMGRELNAIGTVLNQIAARANATGFFLAGEYEARYRQLMEKVLEIQAAVTLPEKI